VPKSSRVPELVSDPQRPDQAATGQDQRQRVLTWNVAPGYQHTFSTHTLTINP
jgi:hypothetical protein